MERTLAKLLNKRIDALREIIKIESALSEIQSMIQPSYVRNRLSDWVSRVMKYYKISEEKENDDEYTNSRKEVYIPIAGINEKSWDKSMEKILKEFQEGNLLTLFSSVADAHNNEDRLTMYLNDEEYKDIFPTKEELPWLFLCGVNIVRDSHNQYGEYILFDI